MIYRVLLRAALLWALANCAYVYLALGGARSYRIETAVLILLALLFPRALGAGAHASVPVQMGWRWTVAAGAAVLTLWLAIVAPLVAYPFLSDDYVFLGLARSGSGASWQFFRPLFVDLFSALASIGGESVVPFHLVGFALHFASGVLVSVLAWRLFRAEGPAVFSFAVFVLNPLQLEAVLWVSGLQELLWAFFILAALVCYTGARVLSLQRLVATVVLVGCGLLSKETAVCYVLVLPAADGMFFRFQRGRTLVIAYAAFAGLLAAFIALRTWYVGLEPGFISSPSMYFLKEFVSTPYQFFVHPWNATSVAPPPVVLCVAAVMALVLLFVGVERGAGRQVLAGAFLVVASTLPVYSYFFVAADLRHARYLYFPAVGWAIVLSALLSRVASTRGSLMGATAGYAVVAALSLWLNLTPWKTVAAAIDVFAAGVKADRPLAVTVAEWTRRTGAEPTLSNGVPSEYQGVWIFLNGYEEFQDFVQRHR